MTPPRGAPSPSFRDGKRAKLAEGVVLSSRSGAELLTGPNQRQLLVSPVATEIWDSLVHGSSVRELTMQLQESHPHARDIPEKVVAFLDRLWDAGLLEGSDQPPPPPPPFVLPLDDLARCLAGPLLRLPRPARVTVLAAVVGGSLAAVTRAVTRSDRPRLTAVLRDVSLPGVAAILAAMVLHEMGHAVACRLVGVPSGPLEFRVTRLGVPRPRLVTPLAHSVESPTARALIAAGGPGADLLLGAAAVWASGRTDPKSSAGSIARLLTVYSLVALNVGTSPVVDGDGSHLLQSLLNDECARETALLGRRGRFANPRNIRIYRAVCAVHVACSAGLIWRLR